MDTRHVPSSLLLMMVRRPRLRRRSYRPSGRRANRRRIHFLNRNYSAGGGTAPHWHDNEDEFSWWRRAGWHSPVEDPQQDSKIAEIGRATRLSRRGQRILNRFHAARGEFARRGGLDKQRINSIGLENGNHFETSSSWAFLNEDVRVKFGDPFLSEDDI